jgi:hypothetical protein
LPSSDERAVGGHEHHPDRCALGEGQRFRLLHHGRGRHDDDLAIGGVVVHREGRDHIDLVTHRDLGDVLADGIDDAGSLVPEARREFHGFDVVVLAPHRLGAVDADRLDLHADLGRTRGRNLRLDEFEDFWSAGFRELDGQ